MTDISRGKDGKVWIATYAALFNFDGKKINAFNKSILILKDNEESVLQRTKNRSKPYCRQLSAQTYAEINDTKTALYQLKKLDDLRSGLSFFKITPLVKICWNHLANGDQQAAKKVAEQARELTSSLPNRGTDAIPHTVFLGSLLIALEEYDKAASLIQTREKIQNADLTSVRYSLIYQDQSFDLNQNYQWLPQLKIEAPLTFATAYGAVVRGYDKQARQWLDTLTNPVLKNDALAGYAAGLCIKDPATDVIQKLNITGFSPISKQRAIALCLQIKANQKKTEQAKTLLAQLNKEVAAWKTSVPATIPNPKGIYKGEYKRASSNVYTAIQTHQLIARYLAKNKQFDLAWEQIKLALKWSQAIAPSRIQAKTFSQNMTRNRDRIQNELAREFDLTQAIKKRNAFNKFRNNARQIEQDATTRFELETKLLQDSLKWGLASKLYEDYQDNLSTKQADSNLVQVIEESLINDLAYSLSSSKTLQAVSDLRKKFPSQVTSQAPLKTWLELQRLIDAGSISQAHDLLAKKRNKLHEPQLELRFACRIAQKAPAQKAIAWTYGIKSVINQELAFQLTATLASKRGLIREYWKICQEKNLPATSKCSVHLGLITGLDQTEPDSSEEKAKSEAAIKK